MEAEAHCVAQDMLSGENRSISAAKEIIKIRWRPWLGMSNGEAGLTTDNRVCFSGHALFPVIETFSRHT